MYMDIHFFISFFFSFLHNCLYKVAEISINQSCYACLVLWHYFKKLLLQDKKDMYTTLCLIYINFSIKKNKKINT